MRLQFRHLHTFSPLSLSLSWFRSSLFQRCVFSFCLGEILRHDLRLYNHSSRRDGHILLRLHRQLPRETLRKLLACYDLRRQTIREKETGGLRDEDIRVSRKRERNSIWRGHRYMHTNNLTPHYTDSYATPTRNNAQHSLSHYDHDGQHLLSAAGSRDADGHGNGHGAELFVLLASRHPQPCPRILCQLGLLLTQEKGKSYCLMSQKCGAAQYDLSLRKSELTWLVCSHA